jgi:hypothetical protein
LPLSVSEGWPVVPLTSMTDCDWSVVVEVSWLVSVPVVVVLSTPVSSLPVLVLVEESAAVELSWTVWD